MATKTTRRLPTGQFLLGALVILIGVLLLLNTTDTVRTENILLYVPSLFVLVGVWSLLSSRLGNVVGPVLLIVVAGAAQLVLLGYATVDQMIVYWPIFIIAVGVSILVGQYRSTVRQTDAAFSSAFVAFGEIAKRNNATAFTGGDLTALFGGTELDLREARIETKPAQVNAVAMFGGVEIIVPREWNVQFDVVPVFGGASDDRPRREDDHDELDLIVTGFAAFGEVSVTD